MLLPKRPATLAATLGRGLTCVTACCLLSCLSWHFVGYSLLFYACVVSTLLGTIMEVDGAICLVFGKLSSKGSFSTSII